ncbi:MAG TPA: amidohydrolase family protein [Bacteroidia bacterium]|nr:amidohydrolase family protein [Bacteroidia bacterium]
MRILTADYIYPISSPVLKRGFLLVRDDGTIEDLLSDKSQLPPEIAIEDYRGIICPGFVNAHCHLELSYLKGLIPSGKGLSGFITDLIFTRRAANDEIVEKAIEADAEMVANGIVVVGDISNSDVSISVKKNSRIFYHNFIEIFDLQPEKANETFDQGKLLYDKFIGAGLAASIVPHAPYTVSAKLLKLISNFAYENNTLLCIHNQETNGENEMFIDGNGEFLKELNKISGAFSDWKGTGFRSLPSVFVHLPKCNKMQFVHNTFSQAQDVQWAHLYNLFVWWCLCPNANLFIENTIPDLNMLRNEVAKITIGTDSYASNRSLSILDELKTIHKYDGSVSLQELLTWATLNGAEYFGLSKQYGSLEKGKKPGINLISKIDPEKITLEPDSSVIPLI